METKQFKTNFKCSGCVDKAKPFLDRAAGVDNWKVDLNAPVKILTVGDDVDEEKVLQAVAESGYSAERI